MATVQELQEATDLLLAADVTLVEGAEAAIEAFNDTIDTLLAAIPDAPSPNTPAVKFVRRLRAALAAQSTYELSSLKSEYGMTTTP